MAEDIIRYDVLVQESLRGVVKKVLSEVEKTGLPGEHHFFISFDTQFPGVRLSTKMRERYPEEMTIVVQHQYWELKVNEANFEVGLSFDNEPERLLIPFAAIRNFFDPSVEFGVQFDAVPEHGEEENTEANDPAQDNKPSLGLVKPDSENHGTAKAEKAEKSGKKPSKKSKSTKAKPKIAKVPDETPEASDADDKSDSAEVVSLDAFRKKPD